MKRGRMKFLILLFLTLSACPQLDSVRPEAIGGTGAVSGVVATKAIEKTKEIFTPKFLLQVYPVEICHIMGDTHVSCFLVPCNGGQEYCMTIYEKNNWLRVNPRVITLRTSSIVAIKKFCEKNEKACEHYVQRYEGQTIVLVGD